MVVGALELGGSHVSGARVDVSTNRLDSILRLPLSLNGNRSELLQGVLEVARSLGSDLNRIGFAAPGPFDYARGVCSVSGLGKLEGLYGVDFRAELAPLYPFASAQDIRFINDAEAFVLGEASGGAAVGDARVIGVTLGTGLGSAFLVDGEIVREGAGVPPDGELHVVPFRGEHVENRLSGRGLQSAFGGSLSARDIASRADAGDPDARCTFLQFGRNLGEFLSPWCQEFNPVSVVVGGSIARAWRHFGPALALCLSPKVEVASQLDEAALLGAARLALNGAARL